MHTNESSTSAPAAPATRTTLRTFVVEDSPVILESLVPALETLAPVEVVGNAGDEAGAIQGLRELGPSVDLVLIDIGLRAGSGLGVLRRLAEERQRAKRAVLTNYATPEMRRKCLALGADEVFDKSNELDELFAYCAQLSASAAEAPTAEK